MQEDRMNSSGERIDPLFNTLKELLRFLEEFQPLVGVVACGWGCEVPFLVKGVQLIFYGGGLFVG